MLQAGGAVMLLAALLLPRVARLRAHTRPIVLGLLGLYLLAAAALVLWRILAGPDPFME